MLTATKSKRRHTVELDQPSVELLARQRASLGDQCRLDSFVFATTTRLSRNFRQTNVHGSPAAASSLILVITVSVQFFVSVGDPAHGIRASKCSG
jgi:hypothetical protein